MSGIAQKDQMLTHNEEELEAILLNTLDKLARHHVEESVYRILHSIRTQMRREKEKKFSDAGCSHPNELGVRQREVRSYGRGHTKRRRRTICQTRCIFF